MQERSANKFISAVAATLLTVVLLAFTLVPAFAESATLQLPVEQVATGSAATATYTLTPGEEGNPMPAGSKDGIYTMTLTGAETETLPAIAFPQAGDYTYTLAATPNSNYACAPASLKITVRVGGDSQLQVIATNPAGEKVSALRFTLTAKSQPAPAPTTTTTTTTTTTAKSTTTTTGKSPTTTTTKTTNVVQKVTNIVNTGDPTHLTLYATLVLLSGAVLLVIRRERREGETY